LHVHQAIFTNTAITGLTSPGLGTIRKQPPALAIPTGLSFHDGILIGSGRIIYRSGLNPGRSPPLRSRFRSRPGA